MSGAPDTARSGGDAGPLKMGWPAWKAAALRTWKEAGDDNVGLVAAGVAFYGFLALVPLLGAIVLSYGIIAEPSTVMRNMTQLTSAMPADAAKLIGEQLMNVVKTSDGKKGLGLLLALALALFGARNGAGAIVTALNIAYDEHEKRGFVRLNLLALAMTAAAVLVAVVAMVAIAALGHLEDLLPTLPDWVAVVGKIATYAVLALAGAAGAATLYRFGPSRDQAGWVWLTPVSVFAAIGWLLLTIGFGIYVAHFGNYNATYGSLGAVVVLLTWLYLSCYILVFGAELNSEFERQAAPASSAARQDAPTGEGRLPAPSGQPGPVQIHTASDVRDLATARLMAAGTRVTGVGKVGLLTSGLSTLGLARIRRGRKIQGLALLAASGVLALLRHERDDAGERSSPSKDAT
ncbi:YihY/virulence factor BrkB family protein [Sphingomonas bacterium]|uniref:YihY/virulence factor BrkB family protein n=1 Tax=Sphingomonas bacterium TaxID=1895847 RepID=UPI0020C6405B|nr:YihY/virulence factor BrkB family protein [Sphingomonas bacterium]